MKKFLLPLLLPALSASAIAQDSFQTPAVLLNKEGKTINAYVLAATNTKIRYKTGVNSTSSIDGSRKDFETIFIIPTARFQAAMDLYEGGKFKEAKEGFLIVKKFQKPTDKLDNNFHTLSAFFEMECMRQLGDYEGLATALKEFNKRPLTRDHQLRQLDLYVMWEAIRTENWESVLTLASERDDDKLPGYQRAQLAYGKALAFHKAERLDEAVLEYNTVMTADAGGSSEIVQKSAIGVLEILFAKPEVQTAIANWGTEAEKKNSQGYSLLKEAASLAQIYESLLKVDTELPENLKKFLEFKAS